MGREFFEHYDTLYRSKDYAAEVATIWPLLNGARRILDVGCGTGEHARYMAALGAQTIGVDIERDVIEIANGKRIPAALFLTCDVEHLPYRDFDAAVSLFNVVNYIMAEETLASFFSGIAVRLKLGSPLIFDCWNGEAALADPPQTKFRGDVIVTPQLNAAKRTVRLDIDSPAIHHRIDHKLWTIGELTAALRAAGFGSSATKWMEPSEPAKPDDWKIMFVCEKAA